MNERTELSKKRAGDDGNGATGAPDLKSEATQAGAPHTNEFQQRLIGLITDVVMTTTAAHRYGRFAGVFSADDLCQETLIKLMPWINGQNDKPLSRAFVSRTSQNVLIDALRRFLAKTRTPPNGIKDLNAASSNLLNDLGCFQKTPSEVEILSEYWKLATSYVEGDDLLFVELRYRESLSNQEIAAIFGLTADAVRTRFSRITRKLREQLATNSDFDSFRA